MRSQSSVQRLGNCMSQAFNTHSFVLLCPVSTNCHHPAHHLVHQSKMASARRFDTTGINSYRTAFSQPPTPTPEASKSLQLPHPQTNPVPFTAPFRWFKVNSSFDKTVNPPASINSESGQQTQVGSPLQDYIAVSHPVLDFAENANRGVPVGQQRWEAFAACHNGLHIARHALFLQGDEIFHLMERLMTWVMDQPDARLGNRQTGTWWIASGFHYTLYIETNLPHDSAARGLDVRGLVPESERLAFRSSLQNATFTVHLVNSEAANHWTVIIYRPQTGDSWHFDSLGPGGISRNGKSSGASRANLARQELERWLESSGHRVPRTGRAYNVQTAPQTDGWSCGLQCIANVLAFLRHEVLGWHLIQGWENHSSDDMIAELVGSLHYLMGIDYTANDHSSTIDAMMDGNELDLPPIQGYGLGLVLAPPAQPGPRVACKKPTALPRPPVPPSPTPPSTPTELRKLPTPRRPLQAPTTPQSPVLPRPTLPSTPTQPPKPPTLGRSPKPPTPVRPPQTPTTTRSPVPPRSTLPSTPTQSLKPPAPVRPPRLPTPGRPPKPPTPRKAPKRPIIAPKPTVPSRLSSQKIPTQRDLARQRAASVVLVQWLSQNGIPVTNVSQLSALPRPVFSRLLSQLPGSKLNHPAGSSSQYDGTSAWDATVLSTVRRYLG
jgi:hypothetical protein